MSSTMPSQSATMPAESSGVSDPNGMTGMPSLSSQAALYLYTFLVTLAVLFAVTSAVIVRTCTLRRRHRRRMEEAIRNGTYVPPASNRPKIGAKPVIHEVLVNRMEGIDEKSICWPDMMPVSATSVSPAHESANISQPLAPPPFSSINWIRPKFIRRETDRTSCSTDANKDHLPKKKHLESTCVAVAILVAMPSPPTKRVDNDGKAAKGSKDLELPYLEFGINLKETATGGDHDSVSGHDQ